MCVCGYIIWQWRKTIATMFCAPTCHVVGSGLYIHDLGLSICELIYPSEPCCEAVSIITLLFRWNHEAQTATAGKWWSWILRFQDWLRGPCFCRLWNSASPSEVTDFKKKYIPNVATLNYMLSFKEIILVTVTWLSMQPLFSLFGPQKPPEKTGLLHFYHSHLLF
jgi:hypothetical protein